MKAIHLLLPLLVLGIIGCQQEELKPEKDNPSVFESVMDTFEGSTRTALSTNNNVVWSEGDAILIYQGSDIGNSYLVSEQSAGTPNGSFSLSGECVTDELFAHNLAVYPADAVQGLTVADDGFSISMKVPSEQLFVKGSFASGSFPMIALTDGLDDKVLRFKNVFGALKLSLRGEEIIDKLVLRGNAGEILAGDAVVSVSPDNLIPTVHMSESGSSEITLQGGGRWYQSK